MRRSKDTGGSKSTRVSKPVYGKIIHLHTVSARLITKPSLTKTHESRKKKVKTKNKYDNVTWENQKLLEEVEGRTLHLLRSASFPTARGAKVRGIQRLPYIWLQTNILSVLYLIDPRIKVPAKFNTQKENSNHNI